MVLGYRPDISPTGGCEAIENMIHLRMPSLVIRADCGHIRPAMANEKFPIDLTALKPLKLDPSVGKLTAEQTATLKYNIQLCRDAIVFFTAMADAKGLGGHTAGHTTPCLK